MTEPMPASSPFGPAEQLAILRARADFRAFVAYVGKDDLGGPLRVRPLDRFVWEWIERTWAEGLCAGVMLPMGAGKTTMAALRIAWEIGRDPTLLVALVTASFEDSCKRVGLVREIVRSPRYRRVFPELKVTGRDGQEGFVVEREGFSHSLTVSAHGVLTGEGVRTRFLVMDDVVNRMNALHEPALRKKVLVSVRGTWMSRRKYGDASRALMLQTAFHEEDAATVLRKDPRSGWAFLTVRAEPPFTHLVYEEWRNGEKVAEGTLPLHESAAALRRRWDEMGPTDAARGLANRPISDAERAFRERHVQGPEPIAFGSYTRKIMYVDPAGDATKAKRGDTDWCAVVCIGQRPDKKWEVCYAGRNRGSTSEHAALVARAIQACQPGRLYVEAVGGADAFLVVVKEELARRNLGRVPEPVKPTTNKVIRVRDELEPHLESGDLLVCGARFPDLADEIVSFPMGAHDDLVDALAGAHGKTRALGSGRILTSGDLRERERQRRDPGWPGLRLPD